MRHLVVDGMNFFIRAFSANPSMDANGAHIGGLTGFLLGLAKLIRENVPDRVYVVWEGEGGSLKRSSLFKDYKAGRKPRVNREYDLEESSQQVESFAHQLDRVKRYLSSLPVTCIDVRGVEADDVIAYVCQYVFDDEDQKIIVSSDRDFYQLLNTKTILYVPTKKSYFTTCELTGSLGILPENYIYMKALTGDRSDNIVGVSGIGTKTTMKLFPFMAERKVELDELFDYATKNSGSNSKYGVVLENRELVIDNVRLMQLTSPLMDPITAKTVRTIVESKNAKFKQIDLNMQLVRDCIQLKSHDFFVVFKEQMNRTKNA